MHWNRWSNVLSLGLVGLMVACGGKEVPPAVAASAGAAPARPGGGPQKGT